MAEPIAGQAGPIHSQPDLEDRSFLMLKLVADISTNYIFDAIAPAAAFTSFFYQRLDGKRRVPCTENRYANG
jgi:hypothetical protein